MKLYYRFYFHVSLHVYFIQTVVVVYIFMKTL